MELSNVGKVIVFKSLEFILEARIAKLSSKSNSVPSVIFCKEMSLWSYKLGNFYNPLTILKYSQFTFIY